MAETIKFNKKNRAGMLGVQSSKGLLVTNNWRHNITFTGTLANLDTVIIDGWTFTASAAVTVAQLIDAFVTGASTVGTFSGSSTHFEYKAVASAPTVLVVIAKPGTVYTAPTVTGTHTALTGSAVTTNILNAKSVMAATELSSALTLNMGKVEYLGDALSRAEYNFKKDSYGNPSLSTPEQILGDLTPTTLAAALATSGSIGGGTFNGYQACGGFVTCYTSAVGTLFPSGMVIVDNSRAVNTLLTMDVRYSSPEDTNGYDKIWSYFDIVGSLDISSSITELPTLKFNFVGNVEYPWPSAPKAYTQIAPGLVADYGSQFLNVADSVLPETVVLAEIVPLADTFAAWTGTLTTTVASPVTNFIKVSSTVPHGITVGSIRQISASVATNDVNYSAYTGKFIATAISTTAIMFTLTNIPTAAPAGTYSISLGNTAAIPFSFGSMNATNFFGFDNKRFTTSETQGFSKTAMATDLSISLLMDQSWTGSFDPNNYLTDFFAIQMKFGSGAGNYITRQWEKVQLADVKEGTIEDFNSSDITFRNTGISRLIYS